MYHNQISLLMCTLKQNDFIYIYIKLWCNCNVIVIPTSTSLYITNSEINIRSSIFTKERYDTIEKKIYVYYILCFHNFIILFKINLLPLKLKK